MKKVLIAMSGGVDSSLAGKLMVDKGFKCIGCTMKLYHNKNAVLERSHTCCSLEDVSDARSAAYKLGIPFYVFNFTDAFRKTVIQKFIKWYEKVSVSQVVNRCMFVRFVMKAAILFLGEAMIYSVPNLTRLNLTG